MRPNAASQCRCHCSRRGHCWGKECLRGASPIGNSDRVLRRVGTGFGLCLCCDAVCGSNPHLKRRGAIPSLCVPFSVSSNSTCTGSVSVRCLCQAATGDFQGRAECFRRRLATERAGRKPIMIDATCPHAHRTASILRLKRGARAPDRSSHGWHEHQVVCRNGAKGRPVGFFMSAGPLRDYTGVAPPRTSLPTAGWLMAYRWHDADFLRAI